MRSLALNQLEQALRSGSFLVDCRPTNDFADSHIPGSISASINGSYEYMVNCIFSNDKHIIVIAEDERQSEAILRLETEGYSNLSSFDFEVWKSSENETSKIKRYFAKDSVKHHDNMVDVSNSEDWEVLHVKNVLNVPLADLVNQPSKIKEGDVLYCGNGHKSMAAASFMAIRGVNVSDIVGGLSAILVDAPELEI